jgi:spore coat protein U-like protein
MRKIAFILMILAGSSGALAGPATTFQARATVVSGCEVAGGGASWGRLDFGTAPALRESEKTASATLASDLRIACTPGVSLSMNVDGGHHQDGLRRMEETASGGMVPYRLYSDAGMQNELLPGQAVPVAFADASDIALPLYGRAMIPGDTAAGIYADTVTVTLSW